MVQAVVPILERREVTIVVFIPERIAAGSFRQNYIATVQWSSYRLLFVFYFGWTLSRTLGKRLKKV